MSILDGLMRGVKVKSRILNTMKKKYKIKKSDDLTPLKETLKQKIELKAEKLRRYEKKILQTEQHFENRQKEIL